jgi:DNA-binding GntR family transcriptional regulator
MRRYPSLTPRLDKVVEEQQAMLEAIVRGDGDTAERIATDHIRGFEQHIRQVICHCRRVPREVLKRPPAGRCSRWWTDPAPLA